MEEGDSGGAGPVAVAGAGCGWWGCCWLWRLLPFCDRFTSYGANRTFGEHILLAEIVGISVVFAGLVLSFACCYRGRSVIRRDDLLRFSSSGTASSQYTIVRSGLTPLALLFVLTFLATRAGRRVKAQAGLAEKRHGRSSAQVIANLSIAGLAVSALGFELDGGAALLWSWYYRVWVWPAMMMMCLAAMVEATADTVSSEIGQAFGGRR